MTNSLRSATASQETNTLLTPGVYPHTTELDLRDGRVDTDQPGHSTESPRRVSPSRLKQRLMLADVLAFVLGVFITFAIQALVRPVPDYVIDRHLWLLAASAPAFALGAGFNKLYLARANERPLEEARNVLKAVSTGVACLVMIALLTQYKELSRLWVITLGVVVSASVLVERGLARSMFRRLRQSGAVTRRIVIVGTDSHAIALMHAYDRDPTLGYKVVGLVGDDAKAARGDVPVLGAVDSLREILVDVDACGVVVSLGSISDNEVNLLTRDLTDSGYHVAVSSSLRDIDISRLRTQHVDGRTLIYVERTIRNGWRSSAKRAFDVSFALLLMILTLPIQLLAVIAIKATSTGPVFFKQLRVGKDGELFEMVKYRTMVIDAEDQKASLAHLNESDGALFKISNDPRVTSVGRWLRRLSIDELPQLYCVLVGTMSIVGPRPALSEEVEQWDPEVRQRLKVLPGLTGLWQVSGRSDTSFEQYSRLDLAYVDNWSLLHDVRICLKTVWIVLSGRGAS